MPEAVKHIKIHLVSKEESSAVAACRFAERKEKKKKNKQKEHLFSSFTIVQILTEADISYNCTLPVCSNQNLLQLNVDFNFEVLREKDSCTKAFTNDACLMLARS